MLIISDISKKRRVYKQEFIYLQFACKADQKCGKMSYNTAKIFSVCGF